MGGGGGGMKQKPNFGGIVAKRFKNSKVSIRKIFHGKRKTFFLSVKKKGLEILHFFIKELFSVLLHQLIEIKKGIIHKQAKKL